VAQWRFPVLHRLGAELIMTNLTTHPKQTAYDTVPSTTHSVPKKPHGVRASRIIHRELRLFVFLIWHRHQESAVRSNWCPRIRTWDGLNLTLNYYQKVSLFRVPRVFMLSLSFLHVGNSHKLGRSCVAAVSSSIP